MLDKAFKSQKSTSNMLQILFYISNTTMQNFYEYRFIFLDFVQIMRANKKIKNHYLALTKQREIQFKQLFDILIADGFLREPILKNEYENLYKRIQIMDDFWISSAVSSSNTISRKSIAIYAEIITQNIYPYLTTKGCNEYHLIVSK